jgi:hypothetical protein
MASSKFSRHPRVQQPPPVCKSGKIPIPLIPPPPHIPNSLWIVATWSGVCTDGIERQLQTTRKFPQAYPAPDGLYDYVGEGWPPDFRAIVPSLDTPPYTIAFNFQGPGWYANAYSYATVPPGGEYDTGVLAADETWPLGQTATFRLYSDYAPL